MNTHTTHTELFAAIVEQCLALGFSPAETTGYILAQDQHGALKPNAPAWLRSSTLYRIQRGECPSMQRRNDLRRITTALYNLKSYEAVDAALETEQVADQ